MRADHRRCHHHHRRRRRRQQHRHQLVIITQNITAHHVNTCMLLYVLYSVFF